MQLLGDLLDLSLFPVLEPGPVLVSCTATDNCSGGDSGWLLPVANQFQFLVSNLCCLLVDSDKRQLCFGRVASDPLQFQIETAEPTGPSNYLRTKSLRVSNSVSMTLI